MKSGVNLLETDVPDTELLNNVQALVLSFTEAALSIADTYVHHAERGAITPTDIRLCLMVETFKYLRRTDVSERVQKWKEILRDEEDGDEEHDSGSSDTESQSRVPFAKSACTCADCELINNAELRWASWEPENNIEVILKRAIDNI
tara:strand:+ start:2414 stop:2854 length:441 start_codon:yes stop_codon:yes gene_type:complete